MKSTLTSNGQLSMVVIHKQCGNNWLPTFRTSSRAYSQEPSAKQPMNGSSRKRPGSS